MKNPRICFIPVRDNASKLNAICRCVQKHFDRKESILIAAPNNEAAEYVDHLLWKFPEESFLPHQIVANLTTEPVAITTQMANLNQAKILFNLSPAASPIFNEFECIYELYDETHPSKAELSAKRKAFYQERNCQIENFT